MRLRVVAVKLLSLGAPLEATPLGFGGEQSLRTDP